MKLNHIILKPQYGKTVISKYLIQIVNRFNSIYLFYPTYRLLQSELTDLSIIKLVISCPLFVQGEKKESNCLSISYLWLQTLAPLFMKLSSVRHLLQKFLGHHIRKCGSRLYLPFLPFKSIKHLD